MSKPKKVYYLKWMNRTRYKNGSGNLEINRTKPYKDEAEAAAAFETYTKTGYAVQLCSGSIQEVETIDNKKLNMWSPAEAIKSNDRWTVRMHDNKIEQTKNEIAGLKKRIENATERLAKLESTNPLEQQQADLPQTGASL